MNNQAVANKAVITYLLKEGYYTSEDMLIADALRYIIRARVSGSPAKLNAALKATNKEENNIHILKARWN